MSKVLSVGLSRRSRSPGSRFPLGCSKLRIFRRYPILAAIIARVHIVINRDQQLSMQLRKCAFFRADDVKPPRAAGSSRAEFEVRAGYWPVRTGELPNVIQRAICSTICACASQFKLGWTTDPGRGSQFWYENWAGLLRGLYARDYVFWKRVICGARSQASSAWVSSNLVCRTWDRTKNI